MRSWTFDPYMIGGKVKSHESDLLELVEVVYYDATTRCIADFSDLRDLETIRSRVKLEGLSFLTITLPNFCKDFERSLALGHVDPTFFRNFGKNGRIPAFLQGIVGLVFDRETGRLKNDESPNLVARAVEATRQICLVFKKLSLTCTPKRVRAAIKGFVSTEHDLAAFDPSIDDCHRFKSVAHLLWAGVISNIKVSDCRPVHGPGQTAERIVGNGKYVWQSWHDRLDIYFPLIDNGYPIGCNPLSEEEIELVTIVPPAQELPVRVTPVPKTQKGPRIIAIEPCCMQYAQQAIRGPLYEHLERSRIVGGHVNFTDQSINRELALRASCDGQLATIDLSEASDRVPHGLALSMFDSNPDLRDAIDSCRSTHATLPDGSRIGPLLKFASMGSALCFPVESMYFYTICVVALLEIQKLPVTKRNVSNVARLVYVYGDDILVPSKQAVKILDYLQKYNCKVNIPKSFWSGKFRESCGMDAYDGYEVTPTYIRHLPPENLQQTSTIISWVKSAGLFYRRGFFKTADLLYRKVERLIGTLPIVHDSSQMLGRILYLPNCYPSVRDLTRDGKIKVRWNKKYQRLEVKAWVAAPVYRADKLDGWAALQKSLSKLTSLVSLEEERDKLHLERTARYGAVALQRRWVPTT